MWIVVDNRFNRAWYPYMIGSVYRSVEECPSFAMVARIAQFGGLSI